MAPKLSIRPGEVFGAWTVLASEGDGKFSCLCECGTVGVVRTGRLKQGRSRSCGCRKGENISLARTTHGLTGHPLFHVWSAMHQRCENPNHKSYDGYGGRGIVVCSRWSGPSGFPHFLEDMGEKPSPDHSIDRIDNEAGYSPDNCRWATRSQQQRNKRTKA